MKLATLAALTAALSLVTCGDPATPIAGPAPGVGAPQAVLTAADGEVVMSELHNPRGLAFGPDGALFVAEAGTGPEPGTVVPNADCVTIVATLYCYGATGSISRLLDGVQERVVTGLPSVAAPNGQAQGPDGLSIGGYGQAYVTIGLETDPRKRTTPRLQQLARIVRLSAAALRGNGGGHRPDQWEFIADPGSYEIATNPDCGLIDSDPFGLLAEPDGLIIADAGANSFFRLDRTGELSTFLPMQSRNTMPLHDGCPLPAGYPTVQPKETVPTSIVKGADGTYYIGQLAGVPITAGAAKVYRWVPGSDPEVWLTGFTYIIAMAFDDAQNLYVLQYTNGINPVPPGGLLPGSVVRVAPDGTRETVITGIRSATGLAIGPDGAIYVTQYGAKTRQLPLGEVLRFTL
ncbi:MAG TPA: ScyD/ScyE family protein [Gemmatimonadaceae bacterium]|nr:ScyD/ScyE family protein [Gemmatimonadaceae bacterium]